MTESGIEPRTGMPDIRNLNFFVSFMRSIAYCSGTEDNDESLYLLIVKTSRTKITHFYRSGLVTTNHNYYFAEQNVTSRTIMVFQFHVMSSDRKINLPKRSITIYIFEFPLELLNFQIWKLVIFALSHALHNFHFDSSLQHINVIVM